MDIRTDKKLAVGSVTCNNCRVIDSAEAKPDQKFSLSFLCQGCMPLATSNYTKPYRQVSTQ